MTLPPTDQRLPVFPPRDGVGDSGALPRRHRHSAKDIKASCQQLENRAPNSPAVLEKVVWIQGRMMHGWGFVYMQAIVSTDENSTEATFGDVLRQEGNLFSNKDYLAAVADVYFPGQPYSIDIYRTEGRLFRLLQVRDPDYEPPLTDFQPVEAGAAVDVPI